MRGELTDLQQRLVDAVYVGMRVRGVNQTWIATRLGMSQKHLSQMMKGRADGSFLLWERIFKTLGIELTCIITSGWEEDG